MLISLIRHGQNYRFPQNLPCSCFLYAYMWPTLYPCSTNNHQPAKCFLPCQLGQVQLLKLISVFIGHCIYEAIKFWKLFINGNQLHQISILHYYSIIWRIKTYLLKCHLPRLPLCSIQSLCCLSLSPKRPWGLGKLDKQLQ